MSKRPFKESFDHQSRFNEATRIMKRYPDRVPIIVETRPDVPLLLKRKYLVPRDFTVGEFIYVMRNKINLRHEQALFLFFNDNILSPTAEMLGNVYENHKNTDQFLYAILCMENTFG